MGEIEYPYNPLTATDLNEYCDRGFGPFLFQLSLVSLLRKVTKVAIPSFLSALRVILFSDD